MTPAPHVARHTPLYGTAAPQIRSESSPKYASSKKWPHAAHRRGAPSGSGSKPDGAATPKKIGETDSNANAQPTACPAAFRPYTVDSGSDPSTATAAFAAKSATTVSGLTRTVVSVARCAEPVVATASRRSLSREMAAQHEAVSEPVETVNAGVRVLPSASQRRIPTPAT